VGKKLVINENGRALLPHVAGLLEEAHETEALFTAAHAAPLRLASSYTIGEYLLPELIAEWKVTHPHSRIRLEIANTQDVFNAIAEFTADIGFIEGTHTHPDLAVRRWRSDELAIVASPKHPLAGRRATLRALEQQTWVLREPGSGTREAADRWLIANLGHVQVELELGSNEAVKRAVAAGMGLGCLSREAIRDALAQGWLVQVATSLPPMSRTLSIVRHRAKKLGSAAEDFLQHCFGAG
jgi:DNA-binding transcriptional LysR family regulator